MHEKVTRTIKRDYEQTDGIGQGGKRIKREWRGRNRNIFHLYTLLFLFLTDASASDLFFFQLLVSVF